MAPTTLATTTLASSTSIPTNDPQLDIAEGLSNGSKAGIGVGVAAAVIVACGILYLYYRRRRRARRTHPINNDSDVEHFSAVAVGPDGSDLKEGGNPLDPPPTYPYEKATPSGGK